MEEVTAKHKNHTPDKQISPDHPLKNYNLNIMPQHEQQQKLQHYQQQQQQQYNHY